MILQRGQHGGVRLPYMAVPIASTAQVLMRCPSYTGVSHLKCACWGEGYRTQFGHVVENPSKNPSWKGVLSHDALGVHTILIWL